MQSRLISILLLFCALSSLSSFAAPAIANHETKLCASGVSCSSTSITAAAGTTIWVQCTGGAATVFGLPTDAGANVYTPDMAPIIHSGTKDGTWYKPNATGFTGSITCNQSLTSAMVVTYAVISGVATASFDASISLNNNGAASGTPWSTGTLVTTNANDIVITWISNNSTSNTFTQPLLFTFIDNTVNNATAFQNVAATQNTAYSWVGVPGAADNMNAGAIAFKAAAAATTIPHVSPFVIAVGALTPPLHRWSNLFY